MVIERLLKEGESLVKKFSTQINAVDKALRESAGYEEGLDPYRKNNLAIMLENTENAIYAYNAIREAQGFQTTDVAKKNDYLNLVTAVMPTLVAEDIVSVQPLKQKTGIVFYMGFKYDSNRGEIQKGDNISTFIQVGPDTDKFESAIKYSSEEIANETLVLSGSTSKTAKTSWAPVNPGSVSFNITGGTGTDDGEGKLVDGDGTEIGTIDYATGNLTFNQGKEPTDSLINYEQDLLTAPMEVPSVKPTLIDVPLYAKPRKLKTGFSLDSAFDLVQTQNIDIQKLMQTLATDEIRAEIDGTILADLKSSGTDLSVTWNQPVPFGISKKDHYASFYYTIVEGANKIWQKTRKYPGNVLIVGENAANVVQSLDEFKAASSLNSVGPHIMGTIKKDFIVVKNPYYGANEFTITYKGNNPFDTGYVYAPYMPITATQFIMDDTFYGRQGYATSFAKKLVANEYFCNGTITQVTE